MTRLRTASRAWVITAVLLFHVIGWKLLSVQQKTPHADMPPTSTRLAILLLLPDNRPRPDLAFAKPRTPERKSLARSMPPEDRSSRAIHQPQLEGSKVDRLWRAPDSLSPISSPPPPPSPTASSPPLDLRLRPGRQIDGHATRFGADPKPANNWGGNWGGNSTAGISDRNMGNGRRRITIHGKCYDTYPSRASQLDPSRQGLQRDLQLVKPCD